MARLVYTDTQEPVQIGDIRMVQGEPMTICYFRPPHKPSSSGHVTIHPVGKPRDQAEFYVGVIEAQWIDREDRL